MARIGKDKIEMLKSALTERNQKIKVIWAMINDLEKLTTMIPDVSIDEYNKLKQQLKTAVLEDAELREIIKEQQ